jgi:hypothetical protein
MKAEANAETDSVAKKRIISFFVFYRKFETNMLFPIASFCGI